MDNTLKYTAGSFTATANINVFDFIVQTESITNQAVAYRAKLNVSYRFPANISANINVNRDSKTPSLQGFRLPIQAADFAIRKSFMGNRASVVFSVNDIFNSRKQISTFEQENIYQASMNRREVRFYKLTLQLPIGKANATFRKKERKMDRTDIDFTN